MNNSIIGREPTKSQEILFRLLDKCSIATLLGFTKLTPRMLWHVVRGKENDLTLIRLMAAEVLIKEFETKTIAALETAAQQTKNELEFFKDLTPDCFMPHDYQYRGFSQ
jgi:hypothetical protein